MVKNRTKLLSYTLPLTTLLALACGSSPSEGTASASASSTDGSETGNTASDSDSDSDPTPGSVSDSDSTPTSQGSMSEGQTEATTAITTGNLSDSGPTTTSNPATSDTDSTSAGDPSSTGTDGTGTSTGELTASTTDTTSGDSSTTGGDESTSTSEEPVECGLQLKATIRDFKLGHPDFETYCCGVVQGLVKPDLGADKKPVFNQAGNPKMLTDAPTFNQWYNNVQDVNQSTQIVLNLQEIMPGVYSYQNNDFFPIDNMLFGNQGNAHNFHFTTVPDTS